MIFSQSSGEKLLMGKNASSTIPQEFVDFFNCSYTTKVTNIPGSNPKTFPIHPMLQLVKSPNINTEADDIFELDVCRVDGQDERVTTSDVNNKGYMEIVRMS
eukprot:Seg3769.6 transcript_id=Seg3769.6/GoldUCD/mRNA.D3Y31 product="hypothetical protein" protein_id=Seg3769.6/GoldUCD/D3Y31